RLARRGRRLGRAVCHVYCAACPAGQGAAPPPGPTLFPYTTLFRSRPLSRAQILHTRFTQGDTNNGAPHFRDRPRRHAEAAADFRSAEHTSELQSRENLVCRLLLEKKNSCRRRLRTWWQGGETTRPG